MSLQQKSLLSLPTEILVEISTYLELSDLMRFSSTCKILEKVGSRTKMKIKRNLEKLLKKVEFEDSAPFQLNELWIGQRGFHDLTASYFDKKGESLLNSKKLKFLSSEANGIKILGKVLQHLCDHGQCKIKELKIVIVGREVEDDDTEHLDDLEFSLSEHLNIPLEVINSSFLQLTTLSITIVNNGYDSFFQTTFLQYMADEPTNNLKYLQFWSESQGDQCAPLIDMDSKVLAHTIRNLRKCKIFINFWEDQMKEILHDIIEDRSRIFFLDSDNLTSEIVSMPNFSAMEMNQLLGKLCPHSELFGYYYQRLVVRLKTIARVMYSKTQDVCYQELENNLKRETLLSGSDRCICSPSIDLPDPSFSCKCVENAMDMAWCGGPDPNGLEYNYRSSLNFPLVTNVKEVLNSEYDDDYECAELLKEYDSDAVMDEYEDFKILKLFNLAMS